MENTLYFKIETDQNLKELPAGEQSWRAFTFFNIQGKKCFYLALHRVYNKLTLCIKSKMDTKGTGATDL